MNRPSKLRILEIGCGSGGFGAAFASLGHDYLGIDIDHRVVEAAQSQGVNARVMDVMELSPEDSYDVVFFMQVLEHIKQPRQFISQVARLVAPGGLIHIDVPNHFALAGIPSRFFGRGSRTRYGAIDWPHHCMSYTLRSLSVLLNSEPGFSWRVQRMAVDDNTWGQASERNPIASSYARASKIAKRESMLVAWGVRQIE